MQNKEDLLPRRIFGFTLAAQAGMAITGFSYAIGNLVGFGNMLPADVDLSKFATDAELMSAWLDSVMWGFISYIAMLAVPKFLIYKNSQAKKGYTLLIYLVLPWLVAFTLDGHARFIAFSLIAAMAAYEGFIHAWVVNPPLRKK